MNIFKNNDEFLKFNKAHFQILAECKEELAYLITTNKSFNNNTKELNDKKAIDAVNCLFELINLYKEIVENIIYKKLQGD